MPLSEDELIKRDSRRGIGKELLESVHQMKKGQVGFLHKVAISAISAVRLKAGLSESQFAELLGFFYAPCRIGSEESENPRARRRILSRSPQPIPKYCTNSWKSNRRSESAVRNEVPCRVWLIK
jgi:hypothetical protein